MKRNLGSILFLGAIAAVLAAVLLSPAGEWLTVSNLKESRAWLVGLVEARPWLCLGGFFLACVLATALCFPAAPIIGLAAGAVFGFWTGLAIVAIASPIGSTIAFLNARDLLRGWVEARFSGRLAAIDRGFERHGGVYLLSLRINPLIPYWLVNLAMGVTTIRTAVYVPLTVIGLFPATFIYVDAGSQLATIESMSDILSPRLMAALLALSLAPLLLDRLMTRARSRPLAL